MNSLFAPTTLAGLPLQNRIVMAPLTRNRADVMGVPKPFVRDYYSQRASAGLIISEGTQTSFAGQGYCRTPGIHTPEQIAAWKLVTDAVHARGAKMFMQFMHCGRIAHPLNRQIADAPVAPSAVKPAGQMWTDQQQLQDYPTPRAFETAELPALIEEFVTAARNAIAAGFDGVELHSANGYLLNQFLASNTNLRTDGYGTSAAGAHPVRGRSRCSGRRRDWCGTHCDPRVSGPHVQRHRRRQSARDARRAARCAADRGHGLRARHAGGRLQPATEQRRRPAGVAPHAAQARQGRADRGRQPDSRERTGAPGLRAPAARGVRTAVHRQPGPGRAH